jgi:formylglycine-generating enzyme required for sulfatase activity
MAWYKTNSGNITQPVGQKRPNQFGLHDMQGNVFEWCEDVFDGGFYSTPEAAGSDPVATSGSGSRVLRGGAWGYQALNCRSSFRVRYPPSYRRDHVGFRPCYSLR